MPPTQLSPTRRTCSFCDNLSPPHGLEFTPGVRHKFFHSECPTCEPQQDRTLCDFCRHLRIRHLLFCDLGPEWPDDFEPGLHFKLTISPSQGCPFCQLLTSIIEREKSCSLGSKEEINKRCKNAYLRLGERLPDSETQLGLCVGLVFYPIMPHEWFVGWETYKQQAWNSIQQASNSIPFVLDYYSKHNTIPLYVGKKVRWDQVRGWLKESANSHHVRYEKGGKYQVSDNRPKELPDGFMVIDVKERKIVNGYKGCRFVALSYVWGNNPNDAKLRATKETMKRLRRSNGVSAHELPATIEDAIQICIELGEEYIWVDRLCIVQDDHKSKQHQIDRMASIFESASLLIVITEGDMECGVWGVRHERLIQDFQFFSGSKFSYGLPKFKDSIEHSRWATRGWTYQEAVLAWKKLFFTPNQVYYMCGDSIRSENFDKADGIPMTMRLPTWEESFYQWGRHLEAYTARSLSHSSDIYNAFIGISSAIYNQDDPLLYGLPRQKLDHALLWCYTTPTKDSPPHQIRTPERDEDLPSWSWSSIIGEVSLRVGGAGEDEFCGSLVEWAVKRAGDSDLERTLHPDASEESVSPVFTEYSQQFFLAVAWSQGCLRKPWPFHQLFKLDFSSLRRSIETQWKSVQKFSRDFISGWDENLEEELHKELLNNHWLRDKPLLISHAQTARFRLKKHNPHITFPPGWAHPKHGLWEVVDEESHCIGMLVESGPRLKDEVLPYTKTDTFEFVAHSISCYWGGSVEVHCMLQGDEELVKDWRRSGHGRLKERLRGKLWEKSRSLNFFDRNDVPLHRIPVVNVILIGRDRNHHLLAHRVSLGWILLTQWAKAERQFKTIFLE